MPSPLSDVIVLQMLIGRQWLDTVVSLTRSYTSILDPRPDLAVPARSLQEPYRWWW